MIVCGHSNPLGLKFIPINFWFVHNMRIIIDGIYCIFCKYPLRSNKMKLLLYEIYGENLTN